MMQEYIPMHGEGGNDSIPFSKMLISYASPLDCSRRKTKIIL